MLYRAKINGDIGVKACKIIGNDIPLGYEKTAEYFVDSSGFGSDSEPALTFDSFLGKVRAGYFYAIREAGQFQVYIREFKKNKLSRAKIFEEQGILSSKLVKNNTRLTVYKNGDKVLRLHNTDIIKWQEDKIILNSGGWDTVTTRSRFNEFLTQYRVYRNKGITYIEKNTMNGLEPIEFFDGIELKA